MRTSSLTYSCGTLQVQVMFAATNNMTNSVVYKSGSPSDTFSNVVVNANFLTTDPGSGVNIRGTAGSYQGSSVNIQAIDPAGTANPNFIALQVCLSTNLLAFFIFSEQIILIYFLKIAINLFVLHLLMWCGVLLHAHHDFALKWPSCFNHLKS